MRRLAGITTVLALVGLGLLQGHFGAGQGTQASHGTGGAAIIVALDTVSDALQAMAELREVKPVILPNAAGR